jgi:hypothetical protein
MRDWFEISMANSDIMDVGRRRSIWKGRQRGKL